MMHVPTRFRGVVATAAGPPTTPGSSAHRASRPDRSPSRSSAGGWLPTPARSWPWTWGASRSLGPGALAAGGGSGTSAWEERRPAFAVRRGARRSCPAETVVRFPGAPRRSESEAIAAGRTDDPHPATSLLRDSRCRLVDERSVARVWLAARGMAWPASRREGRPSAQGTLLRAGPGSSRSCTRTRSSCPPCRGRAHPSARRSSRPDP